MSDAPRKCPVFAWCLCAAMAFNASFAAQAGDTFIVPKVLKVGYACHAFDHLSDIGDQADAAAAAGATIIYASGVGGLGYSGLPEEGKLIEQLAAVTAYDKHAKRIGIKCIIGYVCATSIVNLSTFDANWSDDFRAQFKTPPREWLQQDKNGAPLPSWYGGDYFPACMNNPDWRTYEKAIVRMQLECGADGIFFDNPTVHPEGCYCEHCMRKFGVFLRSEGVIVPDTSVEALRRQAFDRHDDFQRFRTTIARDFFAEIRQYARTIKRHALITANNSLNNKDALYAQCQSYAYNIYEMSKTEDYVSVEDMADQPRTTEAGKTIEYGPTYKLLHAIGHGRPIVAVTIAEADYHTPPNLMRLAMAEAAVNGASYLAWPTWPEEQRPRMIAAMRSEADLLRSQARLLNRTRPRADAQLFLPFRLWTQTKDCTALKLAEAMAAANIQFTVFCEDDFTDKQLRNAPVLIVEDAKMLTDSERASVDRYRSQGGNIVEATSANWLSEVQNAIGTPSVQVNGPATVRAYVADSPRQTVLHLLNLDVLRKSSFEDEVIPATNLTLTIRVPFRAKDLGHVYTADAGTDITPRVLSTQSTAGETLVELSVPRLDVAAMIVLQRT